ncbi:right-handed parallel beta-helix repeat-containing protein [Aquimarina sp. U1-2]|uniref:right-handed parallel beta-helix repeat-containing protein n=1 Tax=Aquimarina sp. U1-2 TaxID=2823141 RepID=UPI001AEC9C96|nr:right-handed parallel beta-helix repeat-containing protein [Aquimarina sp. U1-2]MBP2833457.1 right-handed parallel beta-helix repeat-containing protein [Aquimarina sp. U1-2]
MKKYHLFLIVLAVFGQNLMLKAETIFVKPGDKIDAAIGRASGGDIIIIQAGTYGKVGLTNKNFSENKPLVIRGEGRVIIDAKRSGKALNLRNSSYIVFENIRFQNSDWEAVAVWDRSHHIIFNNCEITKCDRIGLKIAGSSHHIDWIGGKIWDTGNMSSQASFGEGIYLGHSSGGFADRASNKIWIEGVEIYDTGRGEAINVKPQSTNVTIKNTYCHDIKTGAVNGITEGAISVEGYAGQTPNSGMNTWIENNVIENVKDPRGVRGAGIAFYNDPGVFIKNNTLRNCEDAGIKTFLWSGADVNKLNKQWNNTFEDNGQKIIIGSGANLSNADPGINPNSKQTWYEQGSDPDPTPGDLSGIYYFENRDSGKRMRSPDNLGGDMNLGSVTGSDNAYRFKLISVSGKQNTYFIESVLTKFRLSPDAGNTNAGTSVESFNGEGARVEWKIFPADNGYFYVESLLSSEKNLLKMRNDNCNDWTGTKIETHVGTGDCTKWKLIPVNTTTARNLDTFTTEETTQPLPEQKVIIYPNPASEFLIIRARSAFSYNVRNLNGKLVQSGESTVAKDVIDISKISKGVYFTEIEDSFGTRKTKIVIQ